MISEESRDHIVGCINKEEAAGGDVVVDGRPWVKRGPGTWVGPTIVVKQKGAGGDERKAEEIFGPVLMVVKVRRGRGGMF